MAEERKTSKQRKIHFETIKQPNPDNSPDPEESFEIDPQPELERLRLKIQQDSMMLKRLQHISLDNAIVLDRLQDERKFIIRTLKKYSDIQYRKEVAAAIKMSLRENSMPRDREMTYEELLLIGEQIGNVNVGFTEEQIKLIPSGPLEEPDMCSICLSQGDFGKILNCSHYFHVECIDQWLRTKKNCPLCLSEVLIQ